MSIEISEVYREREAQFQMKLDRAQWESNLISMLRLIVFIVTALLLYKFVKDHDSVNSIITLVVGSVLFFLLVLRHNDVAARIQNLTILKNINTKSIARVAGEWVSFADDGEEFVEDEHNFTSDLDIFGPASLFQYLSAVYTRSGRDNLADKLRCSDRDLAAIEKRQEAVKELSPQLAFRQDLEAAGQELKDENSHELLEWLRSKGAGKISAVQIAVIKLLPFISLFSLIIGELLFQNRVVATLLYAVQIILYGLYSKRSRNLFSKIETQKKNMFTYATLLNQIESTPFSAELLQDQKKRMVNSRGESACKSLKKLAGIVDRAELRFNPAVHFFVNIFTLWDLNCYFSALTWKENNRSSIHHWLQSIGEFEALSSLAQCAFDHPQWTFPTVAEGMTFKAVDLHHPLIPENESVGNSFESDEQNQFSIISGSNMSGKSTFLRSLGITMVLAYCGGPVAAEEFSCGLFNIVTSLRNADAVNKKVSTFYAELLRIRSMLDSVRRGEQTFILIDEIFSGTNSTDRVSGAFTVLKELYESHCIGMISTHDLELCSLSEEKEMSFANYHFREEYDANGISFDYKIRSGPSTSRNALYLMKMVGITDAQG